ncbi:hypothetical protein LLEC1_05565 [Akanthomyces lecanii]|uniref:MINDY deubiquitinase domain-containing protein n=1 Tax=Cordyceps confragosa TaxID=2714763 RepID=A0A179IL93_CORDF|nr:hypothetical protein LLEC1_05565 [Akanthomyces lecanii]
MVSFQTSADSPAGTPGSQPTQPPPPLHESTQSHSDDGANPWAGNDSNQHTHNNSADGLMYRKPVPNVLQPGLGSAPRPPVPQMQYQDIGATSGCSSADTKTEDSSGKTPTEAIDRVPSILRPGGKSPSLNPFRNKEGASAAAQVPTEAMSKMHLESASTNPWGSALPTQHTGTSASEGSRTQQVSPPVMPPEFQQDPWSKHDAVELDATSYTHPTKPLSVPTPEEQSAWGGDSQNITKSQVDSQSTLVKPADEFSQLFDDQHAWDDLGHTPKMKRRGTDKTPGEDSDQDEWNTIDSETSSPTGDADATHRAGAGAKRPPAPSIRARPAGVASAAAVPRTSRPGTPARPRPPTPCVASAAAVPRTSRPGTPARPRPPTPCVDAPAAPLVNPQPDINAWGRGRRTRVEGQAGDAAPGRPPIATVQGSQDGPPIGAPLIEPIGYEAPPQPDINAWGRGRRRPPPITTVPPPQPDINAWGRGRRTSVEGQAGEAALEPIGCEPPRQSSRQHPPQPGGLLPQQEEERPALPPRRTELAQRWSTTRQPVDGNTETYQVKNIRWHDRASPQNPRVSPILLQNENGPCPLVALVNALSLTTPADACEATLVQVLRSQERISLNLVLDAVFDELMSTRRTSSEDALPDIGELYEFLQSLHTGMNVNPRFVPTEQMVRAYKRSSLTHLHPEERDALMPGTFENSLEMRLYATFSIPLIHGWLPARSDPAYGACERQAATYEDAQNLLFRQEELEARLSGPEGGLSGPDLQLYQDIMAIRTFMRESATQLTPWGIEVISRAIRPGTFAILFRNDHFSTLYCHPGTMQLLTLVTDAGYSSHEEVVWESLEDVNGEMSGLYSGDFRRAGTPNPAGPSSGPSQPNDCGGGWSRVRSRRGKDRREESDLYMLMYPGADHEQEDRDLALALQLQEEEEQKQREEQERRRQESRLSEQFIEQQGRQPPQPVARDPGRRTSGNGPTSPGRASFSNVSVTVSNPGGGRRSSEHDRRYVPGQDGPPAGGNGGGGMTLGGPPVPPGVYTGHVVFQRPSGPPGGRVSYGPGRDRDHDCVVM